MTTSATFVETTSRLAQWRVDGLSSYPSSLSSLRSDPFKIGKWEWCLAMHRSRNLVINLHPISLAENSTPIASFNIRVVSLSDGRKTFIHPEIKDKEMKVNVGFFWQMEVPMTEKIIIDIKFVDLKIASDMSSRRLSSFAKMLSERIHTDITISTSDGSIGAHRAVLAASSPVFNSMFSHNLKEKELSTINISDMSIEACKAFVKYIYSNIQFQDLFNHRVDLLKAADKYDIPDLKDVCEESLIEDIDTENVLERLHSASMYRLPKLKVCCIQYLVKFGVIFDIEEEFDAFTKYADKELIGEVVKEILSVWKGFYIK